MRVLQVCLLLAATALALQAQATLGSAGVGGTVRDASGAAIPGAKLQSRSTIGGAWRTAFIGCGPDMPGPRHPRAAPCG